MAEDRMKPCPNCDEEAGLYVNGSKVNELVTAFAVCCMNCGMMGPHDYCGHDEDQEVYKASAVKKWNRLPRKNPDTPSRHEVIERLRVAISEQREEAVPKEGEEDVAPMDAAFQAALYEATEGETAETVTEAVEAALNGYIEELETAVAVVRQMKEA